MRYSSLVTAVVAVFLLQSASSVDTCPFISAPDGSQYDLSNVAYDISQAFQNVAGTTYIYNVSICSTNASPCGGCTDGAGVCMIWGPDIGSTKCVGRLATRQVAGLNNGAGVQIAYGSGDVCGSCSPTGPRKSIITLSCDPSVSNPNQIDWKNVQGAQPGQSPVIYINGSINCVTAPPGPGNQVTIEYHGYSSSCNGSDAFMVVVNRTHQCTRGCQKSGSKYVFTDCNNEVFLPKGDSWIKQISYEESSCEIPQSTIFKGVNLCAGTFDYSYQTCDADAVYTYTCNSPYCNQCDLSNKTTTNWCASGTKYQCVLHSAGVSINVYWMLLLVSAIVLSN